MVYYGRILEKNTFNTGRMSSQYNTYRPNANFQNNNLNRFQKNSGGNGGQHVSINEEIVCFKCGIAGHISTQCKQKSENKITCYKCGKEGHISRECRNSEVTKKVTCYRCNKEGHISRQCTANRENEHQQKTSFRRPNIFFGRMNK